LEKITGISALTIKSLFFQSNQFFYSGNRNPTLKSINGHISSLFFLSIFVFNFYKKFFCFVGFGWRVELRNVNTISRSHNSSIEKRDFHNTTTMGRLSDKE